MSRPTRVAVLIGSLRQESFTRKLIGAMADVAPATLELSVIEIGDLPFYNEDCEGDGKTPPVWTAFRAKVLAFDAVLFATPEYNRSVPAVLKNAIDVGSRPYGQSVWDGKPAAVFSVSSGAMGGFGANHHLRQSLVFLNMPTLQQPEAYIGHAAELFDDEGNLAQDSTRQLLVGLVTSFAAWIEKVIRA